MKHLKKFMMYYFDVELLVLLSFFLCDEKIDFHKKIFLSRKNTNLNSKK